MAKESVFLSYADENLDMVRRIYAGLKERKLNVWFDKEDLGPGLWKRKIEKAILKSRYFVICISEAALKKTGDESPGFQDEELQQAYEIARVQPESSFTIIPVRLEDCDRGDHRMSPYQQYDLFEDFESGLDRLAVILGGKSLANKLAEDTRSEDEKLFDSLMGKAYTLYTAGDYEGVLDVCDFIISLDSNSAQVWNSKSVALGNLGRHKEALENCDKAIEIEPKFANAWYNKGWSLGSLEHHQEAIVALNKAIDLDPDNTIFWSTKGWSLVNLLLIEEALEAFNTSIELDPYNETAWYYKGVVLERQNKLTEALEAYESAIKLDSNFSNTWYKKGVVLGKLSRNEEALYAYEKAIILNPNQGKVWYHKGVTLRCLDRNDEAEECFEKAKAVESK